MKQIQAMISTPARAAARRGLAAALPLAVAALLAGCNSAPAPQPADVGQRQATPHVAHQASPAATQEKVPPFHASAAAARPFPKTLPPEKFSEAAVVQAYRVAQEIPAVLAQQPCYCYCDSFGHGSLLDCYATDHGAT